MVKPHLRRQQQLSDIREELRRLPGLTISNVLTAEEVQAAAQQCGLRFRQRLFSPFVTLWLFVWQAVSPDGGCREAVLRLWADRPLNKQGKAIGLQGHGISAVVGCAAQVGRSLQRGAGAEI